MNYKWPVIGHIKQLAQLEADIAQDRISHAYLFEGPTELGKTLVARTFAQILQCPENFCRRCLTCKQIEKSQHIDTLEFVDDGESLKIEEIRELLSHLSTTRQSRHKIIILQNTERMTPEATNALLKTLEEPMPGRIFLLTTTQKQQLMATLLSRVRILSFYPISEVTIRTQMATWSPDLDEATLKTITTFSMGKPSRTLKFLNEPDHLRFYKELYEDILKHLKGSTSTERMLFVEELNKNPQEAQAVEAFLELFVHIVRGMMFEKLEGNENEYPMNALFAMIDRLNQARFDLNHNVNQRLVLENLLIHV